MKRRRSAVRARPTLLLLIFQVLGEQEHERDQEHDNPATIPLTRYGLLVIVIVILIDLGKR